MAVVDKSICPLCNYCSIHQYSERKMASLVHLVNEDQMRILDIESRVVQVFVSIVEIPPKDNR